MQELQGKYEQVFVAYNEEVQKRLRLENKITRGTKGIEVTDLETNEVTIYPSFTLAAEALNISPSSISGYFAKQRVNPFKKRYIFKLV